MPTTGPPARATIADIAKAAGVSIAVVSYALNGRPGVSAATRERVLRVADEFGWRPSAAARSIRTGPKAVGIAVTGEAAGIARAAAFLDFMTATADVVAERGLTLSLAMTRSVAEAAETYRGWWAARQFDVLVVPDPLVDDPRVEALRRVHASAVVLGPAGPDLASVTFDEEDAAHRLADYLLELEHREIAVVTGPSELQRTLVRNQALAARLEPTGARVTFHATNATAEEAAAATRTLLTGDPRPTAIVYDTDAMAVAGLDVARRSGVQVPWDVSIVATADSALCRLATPAITTLPMPLADLGTAVGRAVLAVLDGDAEAATVVPVGGLAVRGSTGPATASAQAASGPATGPGA